MEYDIGDEVTVIEGGEEYGTGTIADYDEETQKYDVWFYTGEHAEFSEDELEAA